MNILILEDTNTFVEEFVDILKNNNLSLMPISFV